MPDHPTTWAEIGRAVWAAALTQMAIGGAAGGLTNALVTSQERRSGLRLIVIGSLVATGMGGLGGVALTLLTDLPAAAIPAGASVGPVAYVLGLFGAPVIELMLARIKGGHLFGGKK
ncbi:hypothetical protein ACEYYA_00985 [Paracoccus sp. p3-h83]|uniref:hypothetical protein n=1 Tax=Paracoccus sp. p3-h83 TaxID=3342805 RepID=UPI0035B941A9